MKEKHNAILKPIVDMVQNIEIDGIEVDIDDQSKEIIRGSIANLSADNLALHQMTGKFLQINFTHYLKHVDCLVCDG